MRGRSIMWWSSTPPSTSTSASGLRCERQPVSRQDPHSTCWCSSFDQARMVRENNQKILNQQPQVGDMITFMPTSRHLPIRMTTQSLEQGLSLVRMWKRRRGGRSWASQGRFTIQRLSLGWWGLVARGAGNTRWTIIHLVWNCNIHFFGLSGHSWGRGF